MHISKIRDLTVIGASISTVIGIVYALWDDTVGVTRRKTSTANDVLGHVRPPAGTHGDLYQVGADYNGKPKATYVRPATDRELQATRDSRESGGQGVFATTANDSGAITFIDSSPENWSPDSHYRTERRWWIVMGEQENGGAITAAAQAVKDLT